MLSYEGLYGGSPIPSTIKMEKEKERTPEEENAYRWGWFTDALDTKAPKTVANYLPNFKKFLAWADMDAGELFQRHFKNSQSGEPTDKKKIPKLVGKYTKTQLPGVGRMVEAAVGLFFRSNELEFHMGDYATQRDSEEILAIEKPQLRKILDFTNSTRMKALIYLGKDSGLRISDLCNIIVEDIKGALDPGVEYFTWEQLPLKTRKKNQNNKLKANPVIGPEALHWLRLWWEYREENGIDCPHLFTGLRGARRGEKARPATISVNFRALRDKSGFRDAHISFHSLRKFHQTQLLYSMCPETWVNRFTGRRGRGTAGAYTKPDPKKNIGMYSRHYEALMVDAPEETQRVQQLSERVTARDDRLDAMEARFEALMDFLTDDSIGQSVSRQEIFTALKLHDLKKKMEKQS